ncbi:MAG: lysine--tRNA ligase [Clostridia bacterium]|nr:lysine--tRNA ligase [Clostridia bacterium]
MHWSEEIAEKIIERNPNKEEYVCAAGISPSGSIHIGNFRDIATSLFVVKALQKKGKKAKLLFSWDEFDRFRKVPVNVAKNDPEHKFDKFIGCPYVDVPDPFGCCENYAKHFENEFEASIKKFGIKMDYRYQASKNRSGDYAEYVILALKKRGEIFDILDSFRTQDATEGEREAYYPVSIYCPKCGRDTTKILSLSDDSTEAEYECECGHRGHFDFKTDFNCKLIGNTDTGVVEYTKENLDGEYIYALTIKGVPTTGTVTFNVTTYGIVDGVEIVGETYVVTYTDGVYVGTVA